VLGAGPLLLPMSNLLETLKERIVVFDGAMGTNLQVQNLSLDDFGGPRFEGCNENLLVTRPDAVEKVHAAFLDVGCDVVETNSFNGTPVDFAEYDIGDKAYDMNVLAAQLAKRVASDYSTKDKPRWVAGSMGPGRKLPLSATSRSQSYAMLTQSRPEAYLMEAPICSLLRRARTSCKQKPRLPLFSVTLKSPIDASP
jgi:methionine synthase I (cobalamin-dependent)